MVHQEIVDISDSKIPKYRQIIASVEKGIQDGVLTKGDALPSINGLASSYSMARETVVKAYDELKRKGLVESRPGKGFFIETSHYSTTCNVFVLFDVLLTPYKECLHDGICDVLQTKAKLDFYYHHYNPDVFCKLLNDAKGRYEFFVVIPFPNDKVHEALSDFDQDKLLLLDIDVDFPGKQCSVLRQSHDAELERALESGLNSIQRYQGFTLVFPEDRNHPPVIKEAFLRFCERHAINASVVEKLQEKDLRSNQAYMVIEDDDLVTLVKYLHAHSLTAGKDLGIVSYNDTPFKEIIEGGITTISVNFREMGQRMAKQVLSKKTTNLLQATELIQRKSL